MVFTGVNTNGVIAVMFFNLDRNQFKILIGNIMFIMMLSLLLLLALMMIFSEWFSTYFELPIEWIFIGLMCSVAMFITNVNLTLWQLEKKARRYATFTILETIINVGLSLVLIIIYKMTWEGRLLGIAVSLVLFGLLSMILIYLRGYITFRFNKLMFTEALAFGLPMIPFNLSGWLRMGVNIVIINEIVGAGAAGTYNLGSQFALIVYFVGNGFMLALAPVIYEKLANANSHEDLRLVRMNYAFFVGILIIAAGTSLVAPYVIESFFDQRYHDSTPFIPWLSFAFAFLTMYTASVHYLFHYKKTLVLSVIATFTGLINLGLCYWLVSTVGAIGAAQASMISFGIMFLMILLYSNRIHPLPWFRFREVINVK